MEKQLYLIYQSHNLWDMLLLFKATICDQGNSFCNVRYRSILIMYMYHKNVS